jgi:phytol kinase
VDHANGFALLLSYLYVFGVVAGAELLRRRRAYSPEFLRKSIHIGVGLWSIGTVLLFDNRWFAIIPPLTFVFVNYLSYRFRVFEAMEGGADRSPGTIYFPLAFMTAILLLWDSRPLVVAALMPLTLGDASAALLGRSFGRFHFIVFGRRRSLEGSISMFIFSFAGLLLALRALPVLLGTAQPAFGFALMTSLGVAAGATLIEAVTPWGLDNLTITLFCIALLRLLAG